ncbi:MAG: flagellar biosynthesis anti-sigma factor FlgM [Synergistaceae bacterium]|nr:flagellar biosynthesis anti-sigma factor FlgM [Synergistaceae bacterium]
MIGRISGQYNLDALNNKKSRRSVSYNGNTGTESDNAKFSSFGTLLAKAGAEMKNIPDIREDITAKFKSQVENGTYNPPLNKVAGALLSAGILDAILE